MDQHYANINDILVSSKMNQPLIHIMYSCGKKIKQIKVHFIGFYLRLLNSSEMAMLSTALWYTANVSTIGVERLAKSRCGRLPGHLEIWRSTGYLFLAWLFTQSNFRAPALIASLYCYSCRKHLVRNQLRVTIYVLIRSSILVSLSSKAEVQLHLFLVFMQSNNSWMNGCSELTQGKKQNHTVVLFLF